MSKGAQYARTTSSDTFEVEKNSVNGVGVHFDAKETNEKYRFGYMAKWNDGNWQWLTASPGLTWKVFGNGGYKAIFRKN